MKDILVLAEHMRGGLREITYELLDAANQLAGENGLLSTALLLCGNAQGMPDDLGPFCDKVLVMEHPELENYNADPYCKALERVISLKRPFLTLIGHTANGMDLIPSISYRLGIPAVTDCLEIVLKGDRLECMRQIYGGKIFERIRLKNSDQYMLSLRPGASAGRGLAGKEAELEHVPPPDWGGLRGRRFISLYEPEIDDVDISTADVLVSVGRGIGKPENIGVVKDLVEALGAVLSCSRPVADKGWLPKSRQVGTSGKTVKPKVYVALGISGAYQHQEGMKNAGTIIAVNKDPRAPIFKFAHYGIVADIMKAVPLLKELLDKN